MSKPWQSAVTELFQDLFSKTTIHGLNIVGLPKLHYVERALWILVILVAAMGGISISQSNWKRYSENPTVVSLQKDFRNWENPFPAVTGCFLNKVDESKAVDFIKRKWALSPGQKQFDYYMDFIKAVANISYLSLNIFKKFENDSTLNNVNMLETAIEVHPNLSGKLVTFDSEHPSTWKLVISELGVCFSVNSKFSYILSARTNKNHTTTSQKDRNTLKCHYLNGLCYGRYDSEANLPVMYYVHSYLDVVHTTMDQPLIVHESEELEMNYRMIETKSAPALRDLSPTQRGCRFDNEPLNTDLGVFSTSMCYIDCRYKMALNLCGCKPFFYTYLGGKVCDFQGLLCLSNHSKLLTSPPIEMGCKCPQQCDIITYLPQVPKKTKWEFGYFEQRITFRWALLPPTTRYHRDILFGTDSLIASAGGTVSLFLGLSVIGIIEVLILSIENIFKLLNQIITPIKTFQVYRNNKIHDEYSIKRNIII